jgi:hypothetical protein
MNKRTMYRGNWSLVFLAVLLLSLLKSSAIATEETFTTLEVGSHVYTNVTVTTKAKNYIFIHHSSGMENIHIADLPEEIRNQLGYVPEVTKAQKASNWAKGKMADLHISQINPEEFKDPQKWRETSAVVLEKARAIDNKLCGAIMGGVLLIYLFFCYCCLLICQKAGHEPGLLIWIPLFQMIPLLRAARMSAWWILTYLLPVIGLITGIVWCFKIAHARGKSPLVGFSLLLPVISFFTFLYLAFADKVPAPAPPKEDNRTDHLMTLETV